MDGTTCRRVVAREVERPDGRRTWVHGYLCGKPAVLRAPGKGLCTDHVGVALELPSRN
jgi:hypothetical protein